MTAMSSLHMGKQLTPTERDILAKYMYNMTDIMLKDDTVFNRTKLHTQRTKYQTEETTVDLDEKMVDGVEVVDGPEAEEKMKSKKAKKKDDMDDMKESREGDEEERMRKKEENKARRLSIRKRDKFRMLPTELKKEKMKAGVEEEVLNFNDMYKEQFEAGLEYYGIDNIRDLPEESKAEFFKLVDAALEEAKMAKKDHDGDGKVETSTAEYMGSRDKAIKKATKPSWDSKQARANALNSLDKKAQARQDMKKEEVEIEEEYTHDDFKKDRIAKVKSTGASGRVIARYRHDDGEIHYTLDHGGNKTSKHPASNLAVHKEEVEEGDYANEPDAQYGDMSDAIPDGNDLNRKKKAYAATQDGDNPMAVEAIKATLMAALQEKKKPDTNKNGIPDYAEDGKGANDLAKGKKGSKPKKGEVPPQFKKKSTVGLHQIGPSGPIFLDK